MLAASVAVSCGSDLKIDELRSSLSGNAVEIPAREVCFGWTLSASEPGARQTAYEIRVSENPGLPDRADVWNSGKVLSDESRAVPYDGVPLQAGRTYWWRVRVWDTADRSSAWSAPERFTTALDPSDWEARWIGAIRREEARLPEGNDYHTWGMPPFGSRSIRWPSAVCCCAGSSGRRGPSQRLLCASADWGITTFVSMAER